MRIVRICRSLFKCNYLKNESLFLSVLFHMWKLHQFLNILKKNKILIPNVFPKLGTVEDLFRPVSKKRRFRTSFDSQHVKGSETLVKSGWEHFCHIQISLSREMIWKISPIFKFEILGLFVNTLTADDKYALLDCENLPFPIQMQLS